MHSLEVLMQINARKKKKSSSSPRRANKPETVTFPMAGSSPVAQLATQWDKARKEEAEFAAKYPEHVKVKAVKDNSQVIGQFIDWLRISGNFSWLRKFGTEKVLALYFEIDLKAVAEEKDAMLEEFRNSQNERQANG